MKLGMAIAICLGCGLVALTAPRALAQQTKPSATQNAPADPQKPPANPQKPSAQANPFPEDTNNVPVLPNGETPARAPEAPSNAVAPSNLSTGDVDPVRSPDDPAPDADTSAQGFSSSSTGLDRVMPPPDTDTSRGRKGKAAPDVEHQETAAEDEKVGEYYLSEGNWKAALSRYESAVVLDPENPEVYWGLGEARRHLGQFAEAKASYEKLVEYDPDSKHGKEAKKILKSPEMANAPTASATKP